MRLPRVHGATIAGRWRSDAGLLLLMVLVVALTTASRGVPRAPDRRTADRAMAAAVQDAGPRGAVVATLPDWFTTPAARPAIRGRRSRWPGHRLRPLPLPSGWRPSCAPDWPRSPPARCTCSTPARGATSGLAYVDSPRARPPSPGPAAVPAGHRGRLGTDPSPPVHRRRTLAGRGRRLRLGRGGTRPPPRGPGAGRGRAAPRGHAGIKGIFVAADPERRRVEGCRPCSCTPTEGMSARPAHLGRGPGVVRALPDLRFALRRGTR